MPTSFTISIPSSERDDFVKELMDPNGNPSSRAKMIAREALAKARAERVIDDILDAEFMGTASERFSSYPTMYPPSEVHSSSSNQMILRQNPPPLPNRYMCKDIECVSPDNSSDEQCIPRPKRKKLEPFLNQQEDKIQSYRDDRYKYDYWNAVRMTHNSPESMMDVEEVCENFAANVQKKQDGRFDADCSTTNTVVEQSYTKCHRRSDWGEEQVPQGFIFYKNFPNFGWIQGTVIQIRKDATDNKTRRVSYSDGGVEDLSVGEIQSAVIECMEFCSRNTTTADNTYSNYEITFQPSSSSTDTASTQSKMQSRTSTTSSKSRKKPNRSVSTPSAADFASRKRSMDSIFNERLDMLREFKKIHGHVNVSYTYKNSSLHSWCKIIRDLYKARLKGEKEGSLLSDENVACLVELGFEWNPAQNRKRDSFQRKFEELLEFKEKYGSLEVPKAKIGYKSLALWCSRVRLDYRKWLNNESPLPGKSGLTEEYIPKLRDIGFRFNSLKKTFEERIEELREFKSKHGFANLTSRISYGKENEALAVWCLSIRSSYMIWKNNLPGRKRGLTEERVKILEEMGFCFELEKRKNKDMS